MQGLNLQSSRRGRQLLALDMQQQFGDAEPANCMPVPMLRMPKLLLTHHGPMQVNVQEPGAAKTEAKSQPADAAALADSPLPAAPNGTAK